MVYMRNNIFSTISTNYAFNPLFYGEIYVKNEKLRKNTLKSSKKEVKQVKSRI